jgi:phage-related protein
MVTIGTLEWSVKVNDAAEAKQQAEQVEESVKNASEAAQAADDEVGGFSERLRGMADAQERAGAAADMVNSKLGFLSSAIMGALSAVVSFVGGIAALKALLVGGVIAGAIAALAIAWEKNWGNIQQKTEKAIEEIQSSIDAGIAFIGKLWEEGISAVEDAWAKHGESILKRVKDIYEAIVAGISGYLDWIMTKWSEFAASLMDLWETHAGPLADETLGTVDVILGYYQMLIDIGVALWQKFGDEILQVMNGFWNVLKPMVMGGLDYILTTIRVIMNLVQGDWKGAWEAMSGFLNRTLDRMGQIFKGFTQIIGGYAQYLAELILAPFEWLYNALVGNSIIPAIVSGIIAAFENAISVVGSVLNRLTNAILAPFIWVKDSIKGAIEDAMNLVSNTLSNAVSSVQNSANEIKEGIVNVFSGISEAVSGGVETAFNAVIPENIQIPEIEIGGGSISIAQLGSVDIPSTTIGGQSIDLPQLESGGFIEDGGLAMLHSGERVEPAEVVQRGPSEKNVSETTETNVVVEVGGIEIGDQSIDLSKLTRREMQELVDMLAERLGNEVRNTIQ